MDQTFLRLFVILHFLCECGRVTGLRIPKPAINSSSTVVASHGLLKRTNRSSNRNGTNSITNKTVHDLKYRRRDGDPEDTYGSSIDSFCFSREKRYGCQILRCNLSGSECYQCYFNKCKYHYWRNIEDNHGYINCKSCSNIYCYYIVCEKDPNFLGKSQYVAIGFVILVVLIVTALIICICCSSTMRNLGRRRHRMRCRRSQQCSNTSRSTSSTIDLLAALEAPPPSYGELYTVGPQDRSNVPPSLLKLPTYEEALQAATERSVNDSSGSSISTTPSTREDSSTSGREIRRMNRDTNEPIR